MQPPRHEGTKKNTKKDTKKNRFHVIVPMAIALAMSTALRAQGPAREAEARAPIEAFFKAFNARDNEALKKTLHYPHVRINEAGGVNVWRDASEAGTNFEGLTRSEGWAPVVVGRDEEWQRMGRAGAIEFCAVRRMR